MRNTGFTLAEVLITLGIIGVVAAMTMPTLMASYQKKVTVNKLKKAYAEISQAIQMSEAEYGMVDTWDYNSQPGESDEDRVYYLFENYIIKRLKTTKTCKFGNYANCGYSGIQQLSGQPSFLGQPYGQYLKTSSGYDVLLHPGGFGDSSAYLPHMHILIDIDGSEKGENKIGKDCFLITLYMGNSPRARLTLFGATNKPPLTHDELKNDTESGCNTEANGYMCGALIMHDGWEIKDDYPW